VDDDAVVVAVTVVAARDSAWSTPFGGDCCSGKDFGVLSTTTAALFAADLDDDSTVVAKSVDELWGYNRVPTGRIGRRGAFTSHAEACRSIWQHPSMKRLHTIIFVAYTGTHATCCAECNRRGTVVTDLGRTNWFPTMGSGYGSQFTGQVVRRGFVTGLHNLMHSWRDCLPLPLIPSSAASCQLPPCRNNNNCTDCCYRYPCVGACIPVVMQLNQQQWSLFAPKSCQPRLPFDQRCHFVAAGRYDPCNTHSVQ
jgi:hypothetical protein